MQTWRKKFSISAEPEGVNRVCVTLQLSDHQAVSDIPQKNSPVRCAGRQEFSIGWESETMDGPLEKVMQKINEQQDMIKTGCRMKDQ